MVLTKASATYKATRKDRLDTLSAELRARTVALLSARSDAVWVLLTKTFDRVKMVLQGASIDPQLAQRNLAAAVATLEVPVLLAIIEPVTENSLPVQLCGTESKLHESLRCNFRSFVAAALKFLKEWEFVDERSHGLDPFETNASNAFLEFQKLRATPDAELTEHMGTCIATASAYLEYFREHGVKLNNSPSET